MFKKLTNVTIILCFFLTTLGPYPQAHGSTGLTTGADASTGQPLNLPAVGTMVNLSPAYQPVIIRGLTVHKDNPFLFDFIVDVGQDKMSGEPLKKEGEKLIKYFLASLAIPDKDVWVNLSPYEKNKMIPEALGQTDMGRDLLEQDYILKQITASLIYPEKQLGKTFWDKVYAKAQQMYGTTQVPVNTFNKVWIMADKAEVFEHNQTAFVVGSHLKVMLEEDYLALSKHADVGVTEGGASPSRAQAFASNPGSSNLTYPQNKAIGTYGQDPNINALGSKIVREIILPQLEREVNTGKNFANLRQIFNSIILSSWYKRNLKEALLNQVYANKSKVNGVIASEAKQSREQIYEQYLKAYKKGVFNYIKEDNIPCSFDCSASGQQTIPRKYFSGGINEAMAADPAVITDSTIGYADLTQESWNGEVDFETLASTAQPTNLNPAMTATAWVDDQIAVKVTRIDNKEISVEFEFEGKNISPKKGKWSNQKDIKIIAEEIADRVRNEIYKKGLKEFNFDSFEKLISQMSFDDQAMTADSLLGLVKKVLGELIILHRAGEPPTKDDANVLAVAPSGLADKQELEKVFPADSFDIVLQNGYWCVSSKKFPNSQKELQSLAQEKTWSINELLKSGTADRAMAARKRTISRLEKSLKVLNGRLEGNQWAINDFKDIVGAMEQGELKAELKGTVEKIDVEYQNVQAELKHIKEMISSPAFSVADVKNELSDARKKTEAILNQLENTGVRIDRIQRGRDTAMTAAVKGGIDLNTSSGMRWRVSKDGTGVEMNVDPAMIERMKRDGVNWLSPVILRMTPVKSIWPLVES